MHGHNKSFVLSFRDFSVFSYIYFILYPLFRPVHGQEESPQYARLHMSDLHILLYYELSLSVYRGNARLGK